MAEVAVKPLEDKDLKKEHQDKIQQVLQEVAKVVVGQEYMINRQGTKNAIARGSANAELTLERATVPADASKRLSALKERLEAERTVKAADAGEAVDPKRIRASISRLEALLERLERR